MHWKIERDHFYKNLPASILEEAGFFYDEATEDINLDGTLDIMSTPIDFIKSNIDRCLKPAILVMTGCMAPLHKGHLEAMFVARQRLIEEGYDGIFGYIAPDHDNYINTKTDSQRIDERVKTIHEAIKEIDWLRMDLWPALFAGTSVNFTDVIYRLQAYIKKYVGDIPVFLVAGGDNARFALTFQNEGGCVIVNRPGYEDRFQKYSGLANNRIFFSNGGVDISSTEIRLSGKESFKKKSLILRVTEQKEVALKEMLIPFYEDIKIISTGTQRQFFNKIDYPIISLDPYMKGKYNLEISRAYDFMGINKLGYVARPGSLSLEEQIAKIPKGEYDLFDDDICTGGTMYFVAELLAKYEIKCKKTLSFFNSNENTEILDARDFAGANFNGGLVIKQADGSYKRRPYYLPYVLPSIRASIQNSFAFSRIFS